MSFLYHINEKPIQKRQQQHKCHLYQEPVDHTWNLKKNKRRLLKWLLSVVSKGNSNWPIVWYALEMCQHENSHTTCCTYKLSTRNHWFFLITDLSMCKKCLQTIWHRTKHSVYVILLWTNFFIQTASFLCLSIGSNSPYMRRPLTRKIWCFFSFLLVRW